MQETGVSAEKFGCRTYNWGPDVRTWGTVRPGKMSCGTGMLWLVQWLCSLLRGWGGGGGFCEEELARVCVPSFLLKPAKVVLGFNNYQVDNFLRRLLFFFLFVKKSNPVFITASLARILLVSQTPPVL